MGLFIIMEYVRVESVFTVHGHSTAFVARVASCRLASLNMNNARGMCVCVASVLVPVCVNSRNSGWHISNGKIANNRRNQTAEPFSRRQLYLDAFDACDCVNSLCLPVVFISFFSLIFRLFFFLERIFWFKILLFYLLHWLQCIRFDALHICPVGFGFVNVAHTLLHLFS